MSTRCQLFVRIFRDAHLALLCCVVLAATMSRPAFASSADETALDATALTQMEVRADHALLRDQCYLYTELVHGWTELAGRQMEAGQDEAAAATMLQVDEVATKLQVATGKDAKRLKNAEVLLEHTTRRLSDMMHVASTDQRVVMQTTLKHLNMVHTSVLAMVFAR
jgi:hypothetical protein